MALESAKNNLYLWAGTQFKAGVSWAYEDDETNKAVNHTIMWGIDNKNIYHKLIEIKIKSLSLYICISH